MPKMQTWTPLPEEIGLVQRVETSIYKQTCLQHTEVLLECKLTSKSPPLVQCQQVKAVNSHLLIFTAVILNANTVFLISATHKAVVCAQYFLNALWLMCIFCPHQLPLQCCLVSSSNKSLLKPLEKASSSLPETNMQELVTIWDYKEDGCSGRFSRRSRSPVRSLGLQRRDKDLSKADSPFWQSNC